MTARICGACGRPLKEGVIVGTNKRGWICKRPVCPRYGKTS